MSENAFSRLVCIAARFASACARAVVTLCTVVSTRSFIVAVSSPTLFSSSFDCSRVAAVLLHSFTETLMRFRAEFVRPFAALSAAQQSESYRLRSLMSSLSPLRRLSAVTPFALATEISEAISSDIVCTKVAFTCS